MEAEEKIVFIMRDKIPSYYDVAISLFQVWKRRGDKEKKAIARKGVPAPFLRYSLLDPACRPF